MGDSGHNRHGPKRWGTLCLFRAELGPRLIQCGLGRGLLPYQVAPSSIQPFGHNKHGPQNGWRWVCPLFWEVAGSPSNTKSSRPRPTSIPTKCYLSPSSRLATMDIGQKLGGLCPFRGGGARSPSGTMWPGPRSTSTPAAILIHPGIWPQ